MYICIYICIYGHGETERERDSKSDKEGIKEIETAQIDLAG